MQRAAYSAVLLTALVILPGCSNFGPPMEAMPASGADAAYVKFVADYIRTTFKNISTNEAAEISEPRWVQADIGWSWLACVHFQDRGHRRTYAVFFKGNKIVDSRYAVLTDGCDAQTYSPLDLTTGALRQGAVGDTGPLY